MINRKPTEPASAGAGELPEDQAPEVADVEQPAAVLGSDATAEDIAALAVRYHEAAEVAATAAEQDQAEYDTLMAAGREKAAQVIAETEAQAGPLADSAAARRLAAGSHSETDRRLATAAAYTATAEKSEAAVQALEDERDELARKQEGLVRRGDPLAAERRDLEAQLASATEVADLDAMTSLRNRIDSIRAAEAVLTRQHAAAQARLDQIGDGEMSPIWPQKELAEARRVTHGHRSRARDALNYALPDRPEAVADRKHQHEQELDRALAEQFAAERAAEARRQHPQQIVTL
jgi:hypothetical protein